MDEALRLLAADDPVGALAALVAAWPDHRDAGLADQIDRLSDHLAKSVAPVPEKRRHAGWLDRFASRQVADLPALMAAIEGTARETKARMDALLELPPDPRTTRGLLAWADRLESTSFGPWGKVWTALFKVAQHAGDPRMAAGLRALVERASASDDGAAYPVYPKLLERIGKCLEKMPPAGPPPPGMDRLIAAVDAATTGRPPRDVYVKAVSLDDRIRDQIYEDPDDDGPIRVWADLLLQAEDPMGTFVTLQLEAERRPLLTKEKALLRKLLEAHRTTLLGPLAPVVDPATAVFRRGILHAAHVRFPTPALRDQLREHPWWRSVRQIVTDPPHLRSGALPNVRRIGMRLVEVPGTETGSLPGELVQHDGQAASWTLLAALAKSRTPLPIEAFCVVVPDTFGDDQLAVLDDLSGLPALRELHLVGGNAWRRPSCPPRPLLSHPAVRALPRLVLDRYPGGHVHKTWETLGRKGREVVLLDPSFSMTIREGATGLDVHVTTTLDMPGVSNHLKQVVGSASGLGKVVVDGPTWAGRDVDRAAEMLAGAAELELPKRKRGT
ncbi:MAG: hypothetical protein H6734_20790 [Alphaproteobacteria bacterium]|nr:hypothetical protein [Alphaproteobacteria bacterium]